MALRVQLWWNGTASVKLYKVSGDAGSPTYTQITLPVGITLTKRRPCITEFFDNYLIITNTWEEPIVVYDDGTTVTAWTAGLAAPTGTGVSVSNGGGVMEATVSGAYITYAHETATGVKLAETNPTANLLSANIELVDGSLVFSGLPTASPDGRVTHIYGYVALEGEVPRRGFRIAFGSSTATVNMTAAALAEEVALPNNGISVNTQARSAPPDCRYSFLYHRRMIYAQCGDYHYRFYYSERDDPEAVDPSNYFDMLGHETITGLGQQGDTLIVFGRRCKYGMTGWDSGRDGNPANMAFKQIHPSIGTLSHHSVVNVNGRLYYIAEDGLRIWNGATSWLAKKMDFTAVFDADPASIYNGLAVNDTRVKAYKFLPYTPGGSETAYFVHYYFRSEPDLGGELSETPWFYFTRTRIDSAQISWREDDGTVIYLTGSLDYYIRQENIASDVDDDSDTNAKAMELVTRHNLFNSTGGGLLTEGKRFNRIWTYLRAQGATVTIQPYAGDEQAYSLAYTPNQSDTMLDPATTDVHGGFSYTPAPKGVWEYKPECGGRGLTIRWRIPSPPIGTVWYGYAVFWKPGPSAAMAKQRT